MTAAIAALMVVAVVSGYDHRRRRADGAVRWWPWLIGVIEDRAVQGWDDLPTVTVGVCLHGPPRVRRAARAALRIQPGVDALSLIGALRDRVASARGDRLFGTVAAVAVRAASPDRPLARLRARELTITADERACGMTAAAGVPPRWLLLAPLAPVVGGQLSGLTAWLAAGAAVSSWWFAARWLRPRTCVRVFATEPIGRPR